MKSIEIWQKKQQYLIGHHCYSFTYWKDFDFKFFKHIRKLPRPGQGHTESFNDVIIMLDTETSKEKKKTVCKNYVVAWTLSVRAYDMNLVTLWGSRPSEVIETLNSMIMNMPGDKTVIYLHNFAYDYVFLRKFMYAAWGTPVHQLNVKPHYPLFIEFGNGLVFKDSLILAQRGLEKWANDMDVLHKKASGKWDYEKIRTQKSYKYFTDEEKEYIEHDTLAGVECIQKTMDALNKKIYSMPFTATGIPREAVYKIGVKYKAHQAFLSMAPSYDTYRKLEYVFHGGYTHNNRWYVEYVIRGLIQAMDFASSYPYELLTRKMPMEKFMPYENCKPEYILKNADDYAFIFKLVMIKPRLKDPFTPMPVLQKSKCLKLVNVIEDNGRVLEAEYAELYTNELDLQLIMQQYKFDGVGCVDVEYAYKDYLPRWFRDYVYQCFVDKCKLKGGDPVLYSLAKARLNSLYGMCAQKSIKILIEENYQTGDFKEKPNEDPQELYEAYLNNHRSILNYAWGCWVTSGAFVSLFEMGACVKPKEEGGIWIYSDTDSCYAMNWDEDKLTAFNESRKQKLLDQGYGPVEVNGKEFWLGVAELDGEYSEFISTGAKRYSCRDYHSGKLKITVAGVPKKGHICLKDEIRNFHSGFIFDGLTTGKKMHTYFFEDDIWTDAKGNERGDSIDLSPADYKLDSSSGPHDWDDLLYTDVEVQVYDED